MAIPAKFREQLREQCDGSLVVTVSTDPCLSIYPKPEWEVVEQRLVNLPTTNPDARTLKRLLQGNAEDCVADTHGRILLPVHLREYARLEKRVVLVGLGTKFELWDETAWNEMQKMHLASDSNSSISAAMESLIF